MIQYTTTKLTCTGCIHSTTIPKERYRQAFLLWLSGLRKEGDERK